MSMLRCSRKRCAGVLLPLLATLGFEAAAQECGSLQALSVPATEIAAVTPIDPGGFRVDDGAFGARATNAMLATLPAFCRLEAIARPTADSEIGIEVWLPAAGWNGKLLAVGNGAWAGSFSYSAMAEAVAAGYAAASTDTGHKGGTIEFALGHSEKLIDFAHRSLREMTATAKRAVTAFYGSAPARSYFAGCSTGGRQALTPAQRYPGDYDGIVAGAAAYHPTHLQGMQVWTAAISRRNDQATIAATEFDLVNDAVIAACDTLDGVADGVLENPALCDFDPAGLICENDRHDACLAPAQAETFSRIYQGPIDADGHSLFPGLARGSERGWNTLVGEAPLTLADDTYRYLVFDDADWNYRTIEPATDFELGVERIGALMNSNDPDLRPFINEGGKLLMYHGWNDPGIPAESSIRYYAAVHDAVGSAANDSVRLFMVPGMNHCRGGVGTDRFDAVDALDRWLETGAAPARIEAARVENGTTVRTRPLY